MSISVLTLLIVYLRYNALYIKLKLFALYNNIFFMKVSKTENRFSRTENRFPKKTGFSKKPVLTSLFLSTQNLLDFMYNWYVDFLRDGSHVTCSGTLTSSLAHIRQIRLASYY